MNNYKAFSATLTGISHSKHGKECQDYSYHHDNENMSIAVVADGHGSKDHFRSAKGAEFAVSCAYDGIVEFIDTLNNWEIPQKEEGSGLLQKIHQLSKHSSSEKTKTEQKIPTKEESNEMLRALVNHIIMEWHGKVEDDYTKNPFQSKELENVEERYRKRYAEGEKLPHAYGTTLIAVAVTPDYWFGIHIGDGRFTALYKDGSFDQPVPWDETCFLNVTTSICDDDAAETARIYYCAKTEKDLPLAVFLCSDGVDDNFAQDDDSSTNENAKDLFSKVYREILLCFAEDGFESTCKQIEDLAHSFATKGKGDDTSIAGLIDMDAVKRTAEIYKKQIAKEQGAAVEVLAEEKTETPDGIRAELDYGAFVNKGNRANG
ncbi:hypothetical protein FACS189461_5280 [Spirochaetia bacterium]|nr:hypothetical protein FACS189461_5280 [Spirochaetia bacterium]